MVKKVLEHTIEVEVRYAEVDKMGIVHHSNYWVWLEILRIKWLNSNKIDYAKMEKDGLSIPLINADIRYILPIMFGETLLIKGVASRPRMNIVRFDYTIYNNKYAVTTTASTSHTVINKQLKPTSLPQSIRQILPFKK